MVFQLISQQHIFAPGWGRYKLTATEPAWGHCVCCQPVSTLPTTKKAVFDCLHKGGGRPCKNPADLLTKNRRNIEMFPRTKECPRKIWRNIDSTKCKAPWDVITSWTPLKQNSQKPHARVNPKNVSAPSEIRMITRFWAQESYTHVHQCSYMIVLVISGVIVYLYPTQ